MYFNTLDPNGRYCMLLRKSREDIEAERAGKFETLTYHEQQLNRLANDLSIKVSKVFKELVSGDRLDERPETQELMREVMRGEWDGVLARDIQRISRGDMIDQGTILNAFKYSNTLIITPHRIFDLNDQYDSESIEHDLMYGRRELNMIKGRFIEGKVNKSMEGQYLGSIAPFGWRKVVIDRKKTLEPDENHDLLVKMYEDVATWRRTPSGIANDFNAAGFRTIRGGYWDKKTVANVLKNPTNIGKVRWNQRKTTIEFDDNMQRKRVRRVPDENELVLVDGLHLGKSRVSPELFEQACHQLEIHSGTSEHSNKPLQNPLAGILVCSECGRNMYRTLAPIHTGKHKGQKAERYTHPRANRNDCFQKSSTVTEVISLLVESLKEICNGIEMEIKENVNDKVDVTENRKNEAKKGLFEAKKSIDNLIRLAEKGLITDDEFASRRKDIDDRVVALNKILETKKDIKAHIKAQKGIKLKSEKAIKSLANYTGRAKEINEFLKEFIEKIEYKKDPQTRELNLEIFFREI